MGFIGLLNFSLICIDLLAWPVLGLVYPMLASIMAIESCSKYHLRQLAIYWTVFALVSLFEFAFVKIIEWIPFWSSIKLVVTMWLVLPKFDGACITYQCVVRPWLLVNLQSAMDGFYEPKKEKLHSIETFLDVADEYIKANGYEALEKLISIKDCQALENSQRDIQALESEEINVVAAVSEQLDEPDTAQTRAEAVEDSKKCASANTKPVQNAKPVSAAEVKETIPPQDTQPKTPPMKKTGQEWNCILCQVKTRSEIDLKSHLRGQRHKIMCDSLKASFKQNQGKQEAGKSKTGEGSQQMPRNKTGESVKKQNANQPFKLWCRVCKLKLTSEIDMAAHVKGRRHSENMEMRLKAAARGSC